MNISGKVFVVTGAGNGIGREVALRLLANGASVAGVDLNQEGLEATAGLASAGRRFTAHAVNITDRAAVAALPDEVLSAHGQVDGVANIAGVIQKFVKVADLPFSEIEKVMNVNFWGVINVCKAFLPHLMARPEASLLNVASMGSYAPVPGQAVYGASKAAVKLLTEALYAELLDTNVHVTVVFPGAISTGIAANSGVDLGGDASSTKSTHKTTSPQEAGRVIVDAIRKDRFRATIGPDAAAMDRLARLNPKFATTLIAKQMGDLLKTEPAA
ncbi:SDR family NAD(P)-dependent oxidoreductase [Microbacterium hatanonis]|uniref:SDR family oxidoreductase n=1 Tax=Microbacterium hatanonis TaxID=404366 RepID=A0A5C8I5B1_9MICO|nr:SDR family oxidoreductase [Microbacterium hatanonis]TXK13095.1 SDR family oxidoreductase [Microbacterium hatanonis]